jgi:hypothetical protein
VNAPTTGVVEAQLIHDKNLNGQIDEGEVVATTIGGNLPGNQFLQPAPIVTQLFVPGTYYLRVHRLSGFANYGLVLSAMSLDTVGDSLATARDLGALSPVRSASEFIGAIDRSDLYRFSVPSQGEVQVSLVTPNSAAGVDIIRDADNDFIIDAGELLANTVNPIRADDELHGVVLPAAGSYYLRVTSTGSNANYTVNVLFSDQFPFLGAPFQIDPTASTTIQAEDFDAGGQADAYFDTTSGNAGGQYRPTEDVDIRTTISAGGFFVSDTAVGEFLEYTVNVPTGGLYDFEFRVSSFGSGATFHGEIDGVDVTGSLQVPNTASNQNFVIISQSGLPVPAGPHILRLQMDTATSAGQAGNYDFIRITPAVGTFVLTPPEMTVAPGERTQLSLAWTVPFGGWRTLNEVELRLRDDAGTELQVKFNEADKLSLFNPATAKFGPQKELGSNAVLSNDSAQIYVATSRVRAAGPTSSTVELVLDISLKPSLQGRSFLVEAAARNDFGFAQPFKVAGSLSVSAAVHKAGDANRDFQFDQLDIVQVLQAAKYLTGQPATFEQGDWNGDGVFDQLDIVAALQTGNYLRGVQSRNLNDAETL